MALINKLNKLGDSIRAKTGLTELLTIDEMAEAVDGMEIAAPMPEEVYKITGDCSYRFAFGGWNWYLDLYGDKLTTEDISNCSNMFNRNEGMNFTVPFDINLSDSAFIFSYMFANCSYLQSLPAIAWENITYQGSTEMKLNNMFDSCYRLREIPFDYFNRNGAAVVWENKKDLQNQYQNLIYNCFSIRKHPDISCLRFKLTASYGYSYSLYSNLFYKCYALDEIVNVPVCDISKTTSNCFNGSFQQCLRINRLTFETNEDGSPVAFPWKNQGINISTVGFGSSNNITTYNSGITADKEVKDAATYEALKNDEDWYSSDANYSRYNHDSAVETINSLPDVSAGSGNTIKFKGTAGALTDGGAINTLTEEEIAVAAAKGWTVSLV